MKQKIRVKGIDGKVLEGEFEIPDKTHLEAQIKYRANVFKPKKGKGSYNRKNKYKKGDLNEV